MSTFIALVLNNYCPGIPHFFSCFSSHINPTAAYLKQTMPISPAVLSKTEPLVHENTDIARYMDSFKSQSAITQSRVVNVIELAVIELRLLRAGGIRSLQDGNGTYYLSCSSAHMQPVTHTCAMAELRLVWTDQGQRTFKTLSFQANKKEGWWIRDEVKRRRMQNVWEREQTVIARQTKP